MKNYQHSFQDVRVGYGQFQVNKHHHRRPNKPKLKDGDVIYVESASIEQMRAYHNLPVHRGALLGMKEGRLEFNPDGRCTSTMNTAMAQALKGVKQ